MTFAGFRTRSQLGLKSPKSVSRNITPQGVTIHYGGGRQGITASTPHSRCEAVFKSWQNFHMNGHGWADLAYTGGFCQHGYALAGRGAGVRTAANGSNTGNQTSYAVVFVGGEGDTPTSDALDALKWWINTLRQSGAGNRVWAHRDWTSTSCPGSLLVPRAREFDRKAVSFTRQFQTPVSTAPPARSLVPKLLKEDGVMGPMTRGATEWYVGAPQDKKWDRMDVRQIQTWCSRPRTGLLNAEDIKALQRKVSAKWVDGIWPNRDGQKSNTTLGLQRTLNKRIREAE